MRPNHRAIAMMFVCLSLCLSICRSGMGVHCDHTVHVSADLTFWLDNPVFRHPDTKACPPTPSHLSSSTWKRGGVWMYKLGMISQERLKIEVKLLFSANRKLYMPRRLAQQRMTLSDLECLESTSSASYAISAVAELLVNICCL